MILVSLSSRIASVEKKVVVNHNDECIVFFCLCGN